MADQSLNVTKVQFSETMNFIGVPYRNMGEALHITVGTEMTQRYMDHWSPPCGESSQKLGNQEHPAELAYGQLRRLESNPFSSRQLGLFSEATSQHHLSESDSLPCSIAYSEREGPS